VNIVTVHMDLPTQSKKLLTFYSRCEKFVQNLAFWNFAQSNILT